MKIPPDAPTRSVAPDNFALFRPYMREGYRALMACPGVLLINNSEAGARDYEKWLELPRDTIKVVRNGFDFSVLDRADHVSRAREFRARAGIPAAAYPRRPKLQVPCSASAIERKRL